MVSRPQSIKNPYPLRLYRPAGEIIYLYASRKLGRLISDLDWKESVSLLDNIFSNKPATISRFLEILSDIPDLTRNQQRFYIKREVYERCISEKPQDIKNVAWFTAWILAWAYENAPDLLPKEVKDLLQEEAMPLMPTPEDILKLTKNLWRVKFGPADGDYPSSYIVVRVSNLLPTRRGKYFSEGVFNIFFRAKDPLYFSAVLISNAAFVAGAPNLPSKNLIRPYENIIASAGIDPEDSQEEQFYKALAFFISSISRHRDTDPEDTAMFKNLDKLYRTLVRYFVVLKLAPHDVRRYPEFNDHYTDIASMFYHPFALPRRTAYTSFVPLIFWNSDKYVELQPGVFVPATDPSVDTAIEGTQSKRLLLPNPAYANDIVENIAREVFGIVHIAPAKSEKEEVYTPHFYVLATVDAENPADLDVMEKGRDSFKYLLALAGLTSPDSEDADEPEIEAVLAWGIPELERFLNNFGRLFTPQYLSMPPKGLFAWDTWYAQIYTAIAILSVTRYFGDFSKKYHNFSVLLYGLYGLGKSILIGNLQKTLGDHFYYISPSSTIAAVVGGVRRYQTRRTTVDVFVPGEIFRHDGDVVAIPELDKIQDSNLLYWLSMQASEIYTQTRDVVAQIQIQPKHPPNFSFIGAANPTSEGWEEFIRKYYEILFETNITEAMSSTTPTISVEELVRKHFSSPSKRFLLERFDRIIPIYTRVTSTPFHEFLQSKGINQTRINVRNEIAITYMLHPISGRAYMVRYPLTLTAEAFSYMRMVSAENLPELDVIYHKKPQTINILDLLESVISEAVVAVQNKVLSELGLQQSNTLELDKTEIITKGSAAYAAVNPRRANTTRKIIYAVAKALGLLDTKLFIEFYTTGREKVDGKTYYVVNDRLLDHVLNLLKEYAIYEAYMWWTIFTHRGQVRYPISARDYEALIARILLDGEVAIMNTESGWLEISMEAFRRKFVEEMSKYSGVLLGDKEYTVSPRDVVDDITRSFERLVKAGQADMVVNSNNVVIRIPLSQDDLTSSLRVRVRKEKGTVKHKVELVGV